MRELRIKDQLTGHLHEVGVAVTAVSTATWKELAALGSPTWRLGVAGPLPYPEPGTQARAGDPPCLMVVAPSYIDALASDLDDATFGALLNVLSYVADLMIALGRDIPDEHQRFREIEERLLEDSPEGFQLLSTLEFRSLDASRGSDAADDVQSEDTCAAPWLGAETRPERQAPNAVAARKAARRAQQAQAVALSPSQFKRMVALHGRASAGLQQCPKAQRPGRVAAALSISVAQLVALRAALADPQPRAHSDIARNAAVDLLRTSTTKQRSSKPKTPGKKKVPAKPVPQAKQLATEQCPHHRALRKCPVCGPNRTAVYITSGGFAFHLDRRCEALKTGQDLVRARGGIVSAIEVVNPGTKSESLHRRRACGTCAR